MASSPCCFSTKAARLGHPRAFRVPRDPARWDPSGASVPPAERLPGLALLVFLLDGVALVVGVLAPPEADLELDPAALQVGAQRHEGEALLGDAAAQLQDLPLAQQQLAVAVRGVVHEVAVAVGGDPAADQEELAAAEVHVGVGEVEPALADGLHLGADERHPRLGPLEDLVVEQRLAVRGEGALARLRPGHRRMLSRHIV